MDIIESLDPNKDYSPSSQERSIKDFFDNTANARDGQWACLVAVITMFKYLYSDRNSDRDNRYDKPPKILKLKANNSTTNYTFGEQHVFENGKQSKDERISALKKTDEALKNYNKNHSIEDVLQHLWEFVVSTRKQQFRQVAEKGFGVIVDGKLIENQCKELIKTKEVKQIIFTGPPGTGKTFTAEKIARELVLEAYINKNKEVPEDEEQQKLFEKHIHEKHIQTVQFHSSYDYSDFVEGLRPVTLKDGGNKNVVTFVRMDGHFKAFCRKIRNDPASKELPYFFIIDEINRADLSRVFGELMYCLDESNRSNGVITQYKNLPTYEFDADEAEAKPISGDVFFKTFTIPENLYILGTMNDIDRSVETFDFALRRRFKWIEANARVEASPALHKMLENKKIKNEDIENLAYRINAMNQVIASDNPTDNCLGRKLGLSPAYHIGHAYFKTYDGTDESLSNIWKTQISLILKEYCRGKNQQDTNEFIEECRKALLG